MGSARPPLPLGKRIWILGALVLGLAHAEDLADLRARYEEGATALSRQESVIQDETRALDQISGEIQRLKKSKPQGLLGKYKLQSRLQQAQSLSERIHALSNERTDLAVRVQSLKETYVASLDRAISRDRAALVDARAPISQRQQAALALADELSQRLNLTLLAIERPGIQSTALPAARDDRDSLAEQANAMEDLEKNLTRQLAALQDELIQAKRQQSLNRELAQLMEEESFFGEQGFISLGVARPTAKDGATALALKNGSVEATPAVDSGSATQGPPTAPSDATIPTTDASTAATLPADKSATKDFEPKAADRSVYAQERRARTAVESNGLDRQISWLQGNIGRMQSMLDHVHQTQREIRGLLQRP